jgi:hypothetical protein
MNSDTGKKKRLQTILGIIVLLLTTLSCSLPLGFLNLGSKEDQMEDDLAAAGILTVEEISISGESVEVAYAQLLEEDLELMIVGWLEAFSAIYQAAPEAGQYLLRTSLNEEPYLEISARHEELGALVAGELDPEDFLASLEIIDLRSPTSVLAGKLIDLGLDVREVVLEGSTLVIEYFPAPAEDQAALMEEWLEIFRAGLEAGTSSESTQIRALMLDSSVFVAEVSMADLEAFYGSELTMFEFLARLMISEEPVLLEK